MYFNGDERDEDFDNLNPVRFVKNSFKKVKKIDSFADIFRSNEKIDCIDDKKSSGSDNKSSREDCRKELGGNLITRGAKVVSLRIPRGAFLTLVKLNYRGLASRMNRAKLNEPNIYNSAISKFVKLGGERDAFLKAIDVGKTKKPLACGQKCQEQKGLNFDGKESFSQDEVDFLSTEPDYGYSNIDPLTLTASLVASASAILVPIIAIIGKSKATSLESQINKQEAELFSKAQEQKFEEDEKKREGSQKMIKTALIGGSILVGVLITGAIIMKVVRKKRNK